MKEKKGDYQGELSDYLIKLRDEFAGKAMQAYIKINNDDDRGLDCNEIAHDSYIMADAMMNARRGGSQSPQWIRGFDICVDDKNKLITIKPGTIDKNRSRTNVGEFQFKYQRYVYCTYYIYYDGTRLNCTRQQPNLYEQSTMIMLYQIDFEYENYEIKDLIK